MTHPLSAGEPKRRITLPDDADQRLKDFGMNVEIISRSIEKADSARQKVARDFYPKIYPGITMWAETLSEWRRQMLQRRDNFEIGRTHGYETIYSVDRGVAFTVVAGDGCTGIVGSRDPRLKRSKGPVTTQRVARNRLRSELAGIQLELIPAPEKELNPDEACDTWFLIVRPTSNEIRLEISRPIFIDGDKIVSGFDERILLPPVPISGAIDPIALDNGDDDSDGGEDLVGR